jgi:hypothetical protein
VDASKNVFEVKMILLFDFELFIGELYLKGWQLFKATSPFKCFVPSELSYCARAAISSALRATL